MDTRESIEIGGRTIAPGEKRQFRYDAAMTYHGDAVEIPVTVINGEEPGSKIILTAAVHGDELNGIKIIQEVANTYEPTTIHGTLVCLHVLNVPGFLAQQRYVPIYDEDLNRSFPGNDHGTFAKRLANTICEELSLSATSASISTRRRANGRRCTTSAPTFTIRPLSDSLARSEQV